MFERLIVTEPETANIKGRRGYFMVTSLVVGAVFLSAVVISIFAADFSLGNKGFEMVELIAPVDIAKPEPAPVRQQPQPQTSAPSASKLPTRTDNVQALMETPLKAPAISTSPSTVKARPLDSRYEIGPLNTDPVGGTTGRDTPGTGTGTDGSGLSDTTVADTKPIEPPPPPPVKQPEPIKKPAVVQSRGVINGMATSLPKPDYPAPAKVVGAQGAVNVQVLIDERGRVISANAVSGHPLLRSAAESAARNARFTPTKLLSDAPVKVSGVIVYNFQRTS